MRFSFPTISEISIRAKATFRRFPASMLSAFFVTGLMLFLIEVEGPEFVYFETLMKLVFLFSLGIFMFTALRQLGEKSPFCILGILSLVAYYFLLSNMKDPSSVTFLRHFLLMFMFFIMIGWAPFVKKDIDNLSFWEYAQHILFGFITSIVFSIILYAGLSGAVYALNTLFNLEISPKRYAQLWFLVMGLFSVPYFLSQIPKEDHDITLHAYSKVENIFTKYILTPLTLAYFLILYAYTFKILLTQSWPKGILAWIIIIFSIVAITTYLFWTPLWSKQSLKYRRFFIFALWLQSILLGVAIWMRVLAYGWTEARFMVAILGGWIFIMTLYFLFVKKASYKWLFLSLSAVILISQIGPFSAYAIGEKNQKNQLIQLLDSHPNLSEKSPLQVRYEISDKVDYLSRKYGIESLKEVLPNIVSDFKKEYGDDLISYYGFAPYATEKLGFSFINAWQMKEITEIEEGKKVLPGFYRPPENGIFTKGYDWLLEIGFHNYDPKGSLPDEKNFLVQEDTTFQLDEDALVVKESNQTIATVPLKAFYKKLSKDTQLQRFNAPYASPQDINWSKKLDLNFENDAVKMKILFFEVMQEQNGTLINAFCKVLYKRK